jgi:hypothetical protein
MTRDVAAQAVHERLEHAASAVSFDVEAGWGTLAAELDGPIAPVIQLRRRRPRHVVALGVAAAILVGGAALAMVRNPGAPGLSLQPVIPIVTLPSAGLVTGPHAHPAFSGALPAPDQAPSGTDDGSISTPSDPPSTSGTGGDGSTSGGSTGTNEPTHVDSPDDIDHGTGNDGKHDDNGQGNDTQGHDSPGQGSKSQGSTSQGSTSQGSGGQ